MIWLGTLRIHQFAAIFNTASRCRIFAASRIVRVIIRVCTCLVIATFFFTWGIRESYPCTIAFTTIEALHRWASAIVACSLQGIRSIALAIVASTSNSLWLREAIFLVCTPDSWFAIGARACPRCAWFQERISVTNFTYTFERIIGTASTVRNERVWTSMLIRTLYGTVWQTIQTIIAWIVPFVSAAMLEVF